MVLANVHNFVLSSFVTLDLWKAEQISLAAQAILMVVSCKLMQWLPSYLGLNEIYVWFLLPTYPNFFNPTLNIKMVFWEKIPKMGTFSDFVTIFFVKCYNKI